MTFVLPEPFMPVFRGSLPTSTSSRSSETRPDTHGHEADRTPSAIPEPFRLIAASWPRPVRHEQRRWTSDPEWDAPIMPMAPQPHWDMVAGEPCWTIDWRHAFRTGLKHFDIGLCGQMRGFHIVFELEPTFTGKLVFHDDDGSLIRRRGEVIHDDRDAHGLWRHEIDVQAGERVQVAQWQLDGPWLWAAEAPPQATADAAGTLLASLDAVRRRLASPDGPPLKMYTSGATPVRAALAIYSMVQNGYAPSAVLLYGDYQWSPEARGFFETVCPFAQIVPTAHVLDRVQIVGGSRLADLARQHWFVMKTAVTLLCAPEEFCAMDDDIVILDRVDDAVAGLRESVFVFAPDADYEELYLSLWANVFGRRELSRTRCVNTGLFWMRNPHDPRRLAELLVRGAGNLGPMGLWEQGFFAAAFADQPVVQLPTQRYFYPLFDGLPGGPLGYDYRQNPCGFATVHFGGLKEKPSDAVALRLASDILSRFEGRT